MEAERRCERDGCEAKMGDRWEAKAGAAMSTGAMSCGTGYRALCSGCYWLLHDWLTGTENSGTRLAESPRGEGG